MTRRDAALLIVVGAAWGAGYPLNAVVVRELSTPAVVLARTGLSALVLIPLAVGTSMLTAVRAHPRAVLIAALLQATIPLVLLTTGQRHVGAALAGILVASQPVWAAVVTTVVDRTVRPGQLAGVILGRCGVALIFLRDLDLAGATGLGGAVLLGAAVFFGVGAVWIERVLPGVPPLATATAAMTVSAVALAPLVVLAPLRVPDLSTAGQLLVLGVVATGGALVLFYALIHRVGAVRANLAGYLAPGFALFYSVVFLGERASPQALAGLALIVAGSYITARH